MKAGAVERVIAIDWSGDRSAAGQRRKIWAGVWTAGSGGGKVTLESGRTREELVEWLIEQARETPRMVVGVDFCFSYPEWFVEEHGARSAVEFWETVAQRGERWLARECEEARFWGRAGPRRTGKKPVEFCGDAGARRMLRVADCECKLAEDAAEPELVRGIAPKSPFQIGGAGAVGTGTLRGIPLLERLRAGGFAVWPFDRARLPMLLEIYPRLLTGPVHKSRREARVQYLRAMKERAVLTPKARRAAEESEDAFDAAVSAVRMGARREEFTRLKRARDPLRQMEGTVWGAGAI
jgi:hypothetical protein